MGIEIERRYLVDTDLLPDLESFEMQVIQQGYLSRKPVVRVRVVSTKSVAEGKLTIKGKGSLTRSEFEYTIPISDAMAMMKMAEVGTLNKKRYLVPHGSHLWQLDEFMGPLSGLWMAEIELTSESDAFESPLWVTKVVTQNPWYTNASLAANHRFPGA